MRLAIVGLPSMDGPSEILIPNSSTSLVDQMALKVDRMMRDHQREFDRTIRQFDDLLAKPNLHPDMILRVLDRKTSYLNSVSENATRIALTLERQRRTIEEGRRTNLMSVQAAERMMRRQKVTTVASANDQTVAVHCPSQPKVRMFVPGAKLRPTIGMTRIGDLPEPP